MLLPAEGVMDPCDILSHTSFPQLEKQTNIVTVMKQTFCPFPCMPIKKKLYEWRTDGLTVEENTSKHPGDISLSFCTYATKPWYFYQRSREKRGRSVIQVKRRNNFFHILCTDICTSQINRNWQGPEEKIFPTTPEDKVHLVSWRSLGKHQSKWPLKKGPARQPTCTRPTNVMMFLLSFDGNLYYTILHSSVLNGSQEKTSKPRSQ